MTEFRETEIREDVERGDEITVSPNELLNEITAERSISDDLAAALGECMDTVSIFHGPAGLAVYQQKAPEYLRWKAALARWEGK